MDSGFCESDWKAFRKFRAEMLEALSERINGEARAILGSSEGSELDRYHCLFDHVRDSDRVIASCFDGWKRSSMSLFALNLVSERLIPEALQDRLSDGARAKLEVLKEFRDSSDSS